VGDCLKTQKAAESTSDEQQPPRRRRRTAAEAAKVAPLPVAPAATTIRPRSTGRPLAAHTWASVDPSFPKLRDLIEIVDGGLRLVDRKLLNVLLAVSYEGLNHNSDQVFSAAAADIRRAIGWERSESNSDIEESLIRLQRTLVIYGYYAKGQLRRRRLTLLAMTDIPAQEGVIYWRFAQDLAPLLANPAQWARLHLNVMQRFGSAYSIRLYELLSLYVNRRERVWDVPVEELRELLSATGKTMANFAQFERRAIRPAVVEVNAYAAFHVDYVTETAPRSKRVAKITFTVSDKDAAPVRTALPARTRDTRTLDFEDGKSDAERGSCVPRTVGALLARIGVRSREDLRERYENVPIDDMLEEWAEWSVRRGEAVSSPVAAFEAWLAKRRTASDTPRSIVIDESPAGGQLSDDAKRACAAMESLNVRQREAYLNMARRKVGDLNVPNCAPAYFRQWVPIVLDELRVAQMI
jgi:Initiator Replication protein